MQLKEKITYLMKKYNCELVICALLIFRALSYLPIQCTNYVAFQYLLSYRYGFIARGLIGSIFDIIPFMSHSFITGICMCVEIALSLIFVLFVSVGLKRCNEKMKKILFLSICIIVMSPASPAFTYAINNFGRFDAILITITILQATLFVKKSRFYDLGIILLTIIATMVHPVFTFCYFCVSEALLFYDYIVHNTRRKALMLLLNTVAIIVMFSGFHFVHFVSDAYNAETMFADLQSRTNVDISTSAQYVRDWYFNDAEGLLSNTVRPMPPQAITLGLSLLFMFPYIYAIFMIWKSGISNKQICVRKRFMYFMMSISWITVIPAFVLEIDFGRWLAALFLSQFIIILALAFRNDENVLDGFATLKEKFRKRPILAMGIIAEAITLGVFRDISSLDISSNIYQLLTRLMR